MKEINYDLNGLEYKTFRGSEQVFQRIKTMMTDLKHGEAYYHFVGHPDKLWNEMGMPDRARKELVPIKQSKQIRTVGLYFPAEWLIEKFGKARAVHEKRDMRFLPEGVSFPIRFYCYGDVVHYIFEKGQDFTSVEVSNPAYAQRHKELMERIIANEEIGAAQKAKVSVSEFPNDIFSQFAVSSYILLDLFSRHIAEVEVSSSEAKSRLSDLVTRSQGIGLTVK